ncbi:MAG: hypothetical protein Q8O83_02340 [bacterium]|nr:hypothetical protein [bacterium]
MISKFASLKKYLAQFSAIGLILFITASIFLIYSIFYLVQIQQLNRAIVNKCEPRDYADWTKREKIPLSSERRVELRNEFLQCQKYEDYVAEQKRIDPGKYISLITKFSFGCSSDSEQLNEFLEGDYEFVSVPDEERRQISRLEVADYEKCEENKKSAIIERPETYKFLLIGNGMILIFGLLIGFALKQKSR